MSEVIEKNSKFSPDDFVKITETIIEELRRREKRRKDREKIWKEVDRQLRMQPEVKYKKSHDGTKIKSKTWMPEMELPLQSGALEVLTSDSRDMMFPDVGDWFCAKSYADSKYLENFHENSAIVINEENGLPSVITHENADDYLQGWISYCLDQFDHAKAWDLIVTDSIKYGNGIGRARLAKKPQFLHDARGTFDNTVDIPIIAPVSIKDVYLDESENRLMADGTYLSPAQIFKNTKKLEDIQLSAKRGKTDPKDENGGWMPKMLEGLEGDKDGLVEYIEYEGDIVVSKSDTSIYIPNAVATVVVGKSGNKSSEKLIRFRLRKYPYSSYIHVPYQRENIETPYSTSPLMKGEPIQRAASEALNRLMQAAILNTEPPIQYPRDDQYFKAKGGVQIYPGAQWAAEGDIKVHEIGDPQALQGLYVALLQQYSDVTGINAPRLGAQTVSHTTAYAKGQEIQRGQSRTVDFIKATLEGPMTQWLYMHFQMSKDALGDRTEKVYMDKFGSFVNVEKQFLPERVNFTVYGSGGPQETAAEAQKKTQALLTAIQVNQLGVQMGAVPPLNIEAIQKEFLKLGGIKDVDAFVLAGNSSAPAVAGPPGTSQDPGAGALGIQNLVALTGQQ